MIILFLIGTNRYLRLTFRWHSQKLEICVKQLFKSYVDLVSIWVPKSFQICHQNNHVCVCVCVCVCLCVCLLSRSVMSNSCDPIECNLAVSVHGILQARILEWVAIYFSRESSLPRGWTHVSWIAGRFTIWATREVLQMCRVGLIELN